MSQTGLSCPWTLYSALLWYSKHGGCKFDNYDPVLQIVICHLGCSQ
ncbi:hypothetical protein PI126_g14048 [Phytophthora idaei]|nr:hypothetical protein PI126_g14048 [Phytophthora idaei]